MDLYEFFLFILTFLLSILTAYFVCKKDRKNRYSKLFNHGYAVDFDEIEFIDMLKIIKINFGFGIDEYWAVFDENYSLNTKDRLIENGKIILGYKKEEDIEGLIHKMNIKIDCIGYMV